MFAYATRSPKTAKPAVGVTSRVAKKQVQNPISAQVALGVQRAFVQRLALVVDYETLARQIEHAVSGWGTDEEAIYQALRTLKGDPDSVSQLERTYQSLFHETLMEALKGDLDDDELAFALSLMGRTVPATAKQRIETTPPANDAEWDAAARRIKEATEHQTLGFLGGTDEETIFAVLEPLAGNATKIESLTQAYARVGGGSLIAALKSELSGSELEYAMKLLAVADPHAGTQTELTAAQVAAVRGELLPTVTSTPSGTPVPWDGRAGALNFTVNRDMLKKDLVDALNGELASVMTPIHVIAAAAAPKPGMPQGSRHPLSAIEGPANAAIKVVDQEFAEIYSEAAATPARVTLRSSFRFTAGVNLRDATDPATRAAMGVPISAEGEAAYLIETNKDAAGAMKTHSFDPESTSYGQRQWLHSAVIRPYVADPAKKRDLELYDQFGYALAPSPGEIVLPTVVPNSSLASGGPPNLADRRDLWGDWKIAVHEYIHNLTHDRFSEAEKGSVMREGFTEYFTKQVLLKVLPAAHKVESLVVQVEGGMYTPPTTPAIVGGYDPGSYSEELGHAENVARIVPGHDAAMRGAFFQGHVEMIGLTPATNEFPVTPPAAVEPSLVHVPSGITGLDDLAVRSGVPKGEIIAANPGVAVGGLLPPQLKLPGARDHVVTVSHTVSTSGSPVAETAEQVAAQNGVGLQALLRANPGVDFSVLAAGQLILIPRHTGVAV